MRLKFLWRPLSQGITLLALLSLLAAPSGSAYSPDRPVASRPANLPVYQSADHQVFLPVVVRNHPPSLMPPLYRLTAAQGDLDWLADNFLTDDYVPAVFTFEDENHAVSIRYRGDTSRWFPKKSWKIRFASTDRAVSNVSCSCA